MSRKGCPASSQALLQTAPGCYCDISEDYLQTAQDNKPCGDGQRIAADRPFQGVLWKDRSGAVLEESVLEGFLGM
eukprot:gene7723-biopygen10594